MPNRLLLADEDLKTSRVLEVSLRGAGFEVTDRIHLVWSAQGSTATAIEAHLPTIRDEVLAVSAERGTPGPEAGWLSSDDDLGLTFSVTRSA